MIMAHYVWYTPLSRKVDSFVQAPRQACSGGTEHPHSTSRLHLLGLIVARSCLCSLAATGGDFRTLGHQRAQGPDADGVSAQPEHVASEAAAVEGDRQNV